MLNRVREAKHTEADLEKLRERVRPYGHSDLGDVDLYIVCTRNKCAKINREYLDSHPGDDILIKAKIQTQIMQERRDCWKLFFCGSAPSQNWVQNNSHS